jgi:hypothetical protein
MVSRWGCCLRDAVRESEEKNGQTRGSRPDLFRLRFSSPEPTANVAAAGDAAAVKREKAGAQMS